MSVTSDGENRRIIGMDIHRVAAEVVSLLDNEIVKLGRVQVLRDKLEEFSRKELTHDDHVVIEATGNAAAVTEVLSPCVRIHAPRTESEHIDPPIDESQSHCLRQKFQDGLGGTICTHGFYRVVGGAGADIDEITASRHKVDCGAADIIDSGQIGRNGPRPDFRIALDDGCQWTDHASIVDDDVDAAFAPDDLPHHHIHLTVVGHVHGRGTSASPRRDVRSGGLAFFDATCGKNDMGARGGQFARCCQPDTAAGAGDERDPADELHPGATRA